MTEKIAPRDGASQLWQQAQALTLFGILGPTNDISVKFCGIMAW